MGPRAGLDGRKIASPPGFDPGLSSPYSVAIPTKLPGPRMKLCISLYIHFYSVKDPLLFRRQILSLTRPKMRFDR